MDTPQYSGLLSYVWEVPDPRDARGRQYRWRYLLALVVLGVASGCRGPLAIFEWVCHHRDELRPVLGEQLDRIPSVSTLQRVLRRVSLAELEERVEAHNRALLSLAPPDSPVWPLDGKWIRTASAYATPVILLTLATSQGVVLRQLRVPSETNEEGAAPGLLAGLDLRGRLVTADAGLTSKKLATAVVAQKGDYLLVVKPNTPLLYQALVDLFAMPPSPRDAPLDGHAKTLEKGHGRVEERRLEVSSRLNNWLDDWPRPGLVLRRWSQRKDVKTGRLGKPEVLYAMTSLTLEQATPEQLLQWWREHWGIENRVFWVRDVTLGEDRCRPWRDAAPQAMAALRNAILARLRWEDCFETLASALRWVQSNPLNAMHIAGLASTLL